MATVPATAPREIRVWDPFVRIFHWLLVLLFASAYLSAGENGLIHVWSGYGIATLLILRVLWGVVGPRRARFSDFVTGPFRGLAYLVAMIRGNGPRFLGHSPAGGLMVVALIVVLSGTVGMGMTLLAQRAGAGPLSPFITQVQRPVNPDGTPGRRPPSVVKEIHEALANIALGLIVLHIGGVVLASRAHGENLARSMVTGRKRVDGDEADPEPGDKAV